jgi:hypothetical protein
MIFYERNRIGSVLSFDTKIIRLRLKIYCLSSVCAGLGDGFTSDRVEA